MNIEAMKLALEALQGGYGDTKSWYKAIESAIKALRTAIQQAEAQQPATPEPVAIGYINEMDELVKYPAPASGWDGIAREQKLIAPRMSAISASTPYQHRACRRGMR